MKQLLLVLLLVAVASGAWFFWHSNSKQEAAPTYRTEVVARRDLVATIEATGTVEPEEVVDVGAQVAGQILTFGTDKAGKPIDYGSTVEAGTVLARIDDSLYAADLAQTKAQLQAAQYAVTRAEADLVQLQAKCAQAEADWHRAERLGASEVLSQSAFDGYKAAFGVAQGNVEVGKAAILQAQAGVPLAEAVVKRSQRNVDYCVIRSPVQGVIIDRRVNIGQTVVSSLNAPSLFLIAKDLRRVQVWAAVNEAEISSIHAGQKATFTCDAFGGRAFRGEVLKVRLNASMTQNVVTYTVEIAADNEDGVLLPYLTANVRFLVAEHAQALAVPTAALSFAPSGASKGAAGAHVFTLADTRLQQHDVTLGISDGRYTEIAGADVREGMPVVVGEVSGTVAPAPAGGTNPFTPQMNRGARSAR